MSETKPVMVKHLVLGDKLDYGIDIANQQFMWRLPGEINGMWKPLEIDTNGHKLAWALMNALNRIDVDSNHASSIAARKTKRLAECKEAMEKVVGFIEVTMAEIKDY
jgi:hypothetical protein